MSKENKITPINQAYSAAPLSIKTTSSQTTAQPGTEPEKSLYDRLLDSVEALNGDHKESKESKDSNPAQDANADDEKPESTEGECGMCPPPGVYELGGEVKKELTLKEIEEMKAAEGEQQDGGHADLLWTFYGWYRVPDSIPRDLGIYWKSVGDYHLYLPPPILKLVESGEIPPPDVCIPPELHNDCAIVWESGLPCGSDHQLNPCHIKPDYVKGNVLGNDVLPSPACITQIRFEGNIYTPDQNGVIKINTGDSILLLYTKEFTDALGSHVAGDYFYKLYTNVLHPCDDGHNKVKEVFTYMVQNKDCPAFAEADLIIKIVDDVPKAFDDPTQCITGCGKEASGNVLCNDVQGADNHIRVKSFTYDHGTKSVEVPEGGYKIVYTELGGKLTVYSNGEWTYISAKNPSVNCNDGFLVDGFKYTIIDADCDTSCAEQLIKIFYPPPPEANDDCGVVYESGLPCGSDHELNPCDIKPTEVCGNLLANDKKVGNACITEICFDGKVYKPNAQGIITVDTPNGKLTVYTQDKNGHKAGDYKYVLEDNAQHPDNAGKNIIKEEFKYTLENKDCCDSKDTATLEIKIVDDVPKARDDCPAIITKCDSKASGNVMINDVKGADKPVRLSSFTYNDGCNTAQVAPGGHTTVMTALGALLTVYSDGSWCYEAPKKIQAKCETNDGFTYTIVDHDGDKSSASQPILVEPTSKHNDHCDTHCNVPPPPPPPVDCNKHCDDKKCDNKPQDPKGVVVVCPPAPDCKDHKACKNDHKHDKKDNHDKNNQHHDDCDKVCKDKDHDGKHKHDKDCKDHDDHKPKHDDVVTCGNVLKDCDHDAKGCDLKILGFKYFDKHNKECDGVCGKEVTTHSGAKFTMHNDGSYKHVQKSDKSFSDDFSFKTNHPNNKDSKSGFSIHTDDRKPDAHDSKDSHGRGHNDDYIVDSRDLSNFKISMKDLGIHQGFGKDQPDQGHEQRAYGMLSNQDGGGHHYTPVVVEHIQAPANCCVEQHFQTAVQEMHVVK